MYIRKTDGRVISEEQRQSVMMLTKLLFRLKVINVEQAINLADMFHLFV